MSLSLNSKSIDVMFIIHAKHRHKNPAINTRCELILVIAVALAVALPNVML